ncbi:MAG TPA: FAD-dependent oxidoreductase [Gaiellaceae bacterium]
MKTTSYWLTEPREPLTRSASVRADVDVVVVGGGVTGCSCALTLAERGLRVRLLEAREIAGGASGRNGGFALRGGAMAYAPAWAELWRLTERALDRLELLAGDAFRRIGSLRLAAGEAELETLARERELLRADGFQVEWLAQLPPPLDRLYAGALLNPRDGALQPARWVRRLAQHAVAAGAELVEGETAALDELEAPIVVVAVDGLTAAVLPELAELVRPIRGQMLATAPLERVVYARPHYARDGYDYWQQLPDGRLVIGGKRDVSFETEASSLEETNDVVQGQLEALVVELLGELPEITHRWAGVWGETVDRLPLVGRVPGRENVWVAGGYSGHGNVLGLACGELVARAVAGDSPPELALFDPARLKLDPSRA